MPVANVGNNYQYQINLITYVSDNDNGNSNINYSISGLDWLKFDNENRTLYGTPIEQGLYNFTLTGNNQYSSISNLYNIIVQQQDNTTLNQFYFQKQLNSFGVTNGHNGIVVKPGNEFYFKFNNSIFNNVGNAQFFGRLADHSPLPNWIKFNGDDLSFSGTAPYVTSEIAPSIKYQFSIIASTNGFSLAEGFFDLIIGANQLWVNDSMITYNGTFNQDIELKLPLNQVYLNGYPIAISNVSLIVPQNLPNYLKFQNNTLIGQFPNYTTTDNFSILLTDVYQNSILFTYSIKSIDSLFSGSFLDLNVTRGEYFQYQIDNSSFTKTNLTINLDYSATWLNWHQSNYTLNGQVPKDFDNLKIEVKLTNDNRQNTESFQLKGVDPKSTPTTTNSPEASSTASSTASSIATSSPPSVNKSSKTNKKLIIGLAVGIPCFVLLLLAILLIFCLRRRRTKGKNESSLSIHSDNEKKQANYEQNSHSSPPTRLTSLNLLNLDKSIDELGNSKQKSDYDTKSTSSSLTHVDSNDSHYFDATDVPVKSWRMEDKSDTKNIKDNRVSDTSLNTVNTDQLFSIRLIDEKNSSRNSISGPLNLSRDNSGNLQRLDSDGQIVDHYDNVDIWSIPKDKRTHSQNLDILLEETSNHRKYSNESRYHNYNIDSNEDSTNINDLMPNKVSKEEKPVAPIKENSLNSLNSNNQTINTENSSINLLSKFDNPQLQKSKSDNNFGDLSSYDDDEFKATKTDNGEFKWLQASNNSKTNLMSPSGETIVQGKPNVSAGQLNLNNSTLSTKSNQSTEYLNEKSLNSNNSGKPKAKLVEFTRKGSLRESAYEADYRYKEESAKIIEDDSD